MIRNMRDFLVGIALIAFALALYFYITPKYVPDVEYGAMSPRFFPNFGTILVGLGGAALVLGSLIVKRSGVDAGTETDRGSPVNVLLSVAALVCFILLFQWFGYFFAAIPVIAGLMFVFGGRNPLTIGLVSVVTASVLYVLFSYGLKLPLV